MSIPITQGSLQTTVSSMNIGDYIAALYTTTAMTANGTFSQLGTVDTSTASPFSSSALTGYVYLMKIAKGVIVSTSQLYNGVPYTTLNTANYIFGSKTTLANKDFLVRVPKLSEYIAMWGTLNGKVSTSDILTNYGISGSSIYEIIQENNASLQAGTFRVDLTTYSAASNIADVDQTATKYARLVLEYVDDSKCTDLYH
jgi:hypothetical protein